MKNVPVNYGYYEPINTSNGRLRRTKIHAFDNVSRGEPLCGVYIADYSARQFVKTNSLNTNDFFEPDGCMNCDIILG